MKPVIKAMEIAKENGVKIVFDLDVSPKHFIEEAELAAREELEYVLEMTDILVPCKAAAAELIGSTDFEKNGSKLLEYGSEICAVTLGEKGCIIFNDKELHKIDGYKVDVKDTTGAGDAFHGGFIYGPINDLPLPEIGKIANACGAVCCKKVGARSMGNYEEIMGLVNC